MILDLIRECKTILIEIIRNWKRTVLDAEDVQYKILKEKVKLERKFEDEKKESAGGELQDDQKPLVSEGARKRTSEDDCGVKQKPDYL